MTTLLSPHLPLVGRPTFTLEDWWVTALDGRLVDVEDAAYPVLILGIHRGVDDDLWIQLAPFDQADRDMLRVDRGVTAHCHASDTPDDVLLTLRAHLAFNGARHGGRLEVASSRLIRP